MAYMEWRSVRSGHPSPLPDHVTPTSTLHRNQPTRLTISHEPARKPPVRLLAGIGAALLAFVLVGFAFSKNYEILAEGQLLPYTEGKVARVRFFDAFTIYIAREPIRLLDVATTIALAMLAGISLLAVAMSVRRPRMAGRVRAFFIVCLFGAMYLAADESLAIHETLGHNMQFLMDLPGVHRPDDLIFASYIVPALIVLVVFRDILRASTGALAFFAAAIGIFVGAAFFDVVGVGIDELLEPLSAACIIAGFVAVAVVQLDEPA